MWTNLRAEAKRLAPRKIAELFDLPGRMDRFSVAEEGLFFDFSKTKIDDAALNALLSLVDKTGITLRRDAMFSGDKINQTEGRAVLHTALRTRQDGPIVVDGADILPEIRDTRARMADFAVELRAGAIAGTHGPISDIVNIGIGGSGLGPEMAVRALSPYHDGPTCHFVSNVDGAQLSDVLAPLDPGRTLVIVASKTFTTQETMLNAGSARAWMEAGGGDPRAQFAAISTARDKTAAFGIPAERVFGFADWVGGRYSIWGPIGLALMCAIGPERFAAFLAGGDAMDRHFRTAPMDRNLPVLLALIGIWHHQVCGHPTRAVLPYEERLARLPAYLQQLEMESNGKGVAMDGTKLAGVSGPVVWGAPGTDGQHAFFQLLHQGTQVVPCEFLVGSMGHEPDLDHHHRVLLANCLAQSEALMQGRSEDEARALAEAAGLTGAARDRMARHRCFPGDRPSTTLVYPRLTPFVLGQIIALYEHRVFVEGAVLGINSFDQWGVELGKALAGPLVTSLETGHPPTGSASTQALWSHLRATRANEK